MLPARAGARSMSARDALIKQLRSVQPPLAESEITRERLSLEEAVRKVESEAAQRYRDAHRANTRLDPTEIALRSIQDALNISTAEAQQNEQRKLKGELEKHAAEAEKAKREAEERQQLSEIDRATRAQDDAVRERQELEAARVQKEARRRVVRAELAKVASPAPKLRDGLLDAGPNAIYDYPTSSDHLATLPIRQRAILKTLMSDLPGNSPKYLRTSLESYDEELQVRGVQPILGLLRDIFEIIEAAVDDPRATQEWLEPGLQKAFEKLAENNRLLLKHFPLDPEREELYARTRVDEDEATGKLLSEPFKEVAQAAKGANRAGVTTDDFLKVVDKMAEFAKIISGLPSPVPPSIRPISKSDSNSEQRDQPISSKKRVLLSGFGFFERVYNLLGSTATLATTPEGLALFAALGEAIGALSKFLG